MHTHSTITCRMYTVCHKSRFLNVNSRQLDLMCYADMCCTYDACQIILLVGIILLLTICNLWVVRSASVNLHFVNSVVCGGDDGGGEDIGDVVGHVHGSVIHD